MFFIDDMGYGDIGCFGAPTTATPNIDLMAAQGVKLTQWYSAAPLCTPSRAGLLTGRLPKRSGLCGGVFPCDASNGIPRNETTWPEVLQRAGWATAMVGKWHLGQLPEFRPTERGFDSYLGVPYSVDMGCSYHTTTNHTTVCSGNITTHPCGGLPLLDGQTIVEQPTDLTTLTIRYTARVLAHIRNASAFGRNWAAYYAFSHVHTPQFAGAKFAGRSRRGIFGDSVEEVDSAVGEVLDLIRRLGLQDTTLALLSSDNGAPAALPQWTNERQDMEPTPYTGINAPFTGTKWQVWEGGVRMPAIAWGGPVVGAARTAIDVVSSTDVYATVMDWAGLPRRSGRSDETIDDSISFMHLLTAAGMRGYTGPPARNETFLYGGCELGAVRVGAYKAMLGQPAPSQYHMYCNTGKPRPNGDEGKPWGTCVNVAAQNNTVDGGPLIFQIEHDPGERFPLRVNSSEYERVLQDVNAAIARHKASMFALPQLLPHKVDGHSCCRDAAAAVCCRNSSEGGLPACYCNAPPTAAQ
jgi:arylsulfatase A